MQVKSKHRGHMAAPCLSDAKQTPGPSPDHAGNDIAEHLGHFCSSRSGRRAVGTLPIGTSAGIRILTAGFSVFQQTVRPETNCGRVIDFSAKATHQTASSFKPGKPATTKGTLSCRANLRDPRSNDWTQHLQHRLEERKLPHALCPRCRTAGSLKQASRACSTIASAPLRMPTIATHRSSRRAYWHGWNIMAAGGQRQPRGSRDQQGLPFRP